MGGERERCIDIYIYMNPIPFGLMRLGFLSSVMNTQANFCCAVLISAYNNRQEITSDAQHILYIICCIPYITYYTLHIIYYIIYVAYCILNIIYYML